VREAGKIVSPGPSCTLVLRTEYPELVGTSEAREVSEAVMDLSDFLLQQARHKKLPKGFKSPSARSRYHVACHNRVQNLGYRGRDLLKVGRGGRAAGGPLLRDGRHLGHEDRILPGVLEGGRCRGQAGRECRGRRRLFGLPLAGLQLKQKTGRPVYHRCASCGRPYLESPAFAQGRRSPASGGQFDGASSS